MVIGQRGPAITSNLASVRFAAPAKLCTVVRCGLLASHAVLYCTVGILHRPQVPWVRTSQLWEVLSDGVTALLWYFCFGRVCIRSISGSLWKWLE